MCLSQTLIAAGSLLQYCLQHTKRETHESSASDESAGCFPMMSRRELQQGAGLCCSPAEVLRARRTTQPQTWLLCIPVRPLQVHGRSYLYISLSPYLPLLLPSLHFPRGESYTDLGRYVRCILTTPLALAILTEGQLGRQEQNDRPGEAPAKTGTQWHKTPFGSLHRLGFCPRNWLASCLLPPTLLPTDHFLRDRLASHCCDPACHSGPSPPPPG